MPRSGAGSRRTMPASGTATSSRARRPPPRSASNQTASRSSKTGSSSRARRSWAVSPRSMSPTWMRRWRWRRPGRAEGRLRSARSLSSAEPLDPAVASPESALTQVFRDEAGRATATLMRRFGDFDLAEECTQDAVVAALEKWPRDGVPDNPLSWLVTVATRRALNRLKRDRRYREKLAEVALEPQQDQEDDRLRLILTCCHPALSREAQVGLTLR